MGTLLRVSSAVCMSESCKRFASWAVIIKTVLSNDRSSEHSLVPIGHFPLHVSHNPNFIFSLELFLVGFLCILIQNITLFSFLWFLSVEFDA